MAMRTELSATEKAFVLRLRVAHLATSDEHGSPTLVPVCYAFDGSSFYTPLDQKPKRVPGMQLRRVHNIEARHEASLLIDHYSDDWTQLGYVQVYGRAELLYPDHPLHTPALRLLRERYSQYRQMNLEEAPFIHLIPQRIRSWGTPARETE